MPRPSPWNPCLCWSPPCPPINGLQIVCFFESSGLAGRFPAGFLQSLSLLAPFAFLMWVASDRVYRMLVSDCLPSCGWLWPRLWKACLHLSPFVSLHLHGWSFLVSLHVSGPSRWALNPGILLDLLYTLYVPVRVRRITQKSFRAHSTGNYL